MKGVLIIDGECRFCRAWAGRLERALPLKVREFQSLGTAFPEIPRELFRHKVVLSESPRYYSGAQAVFRALAHYSPSAAIPLALYHRWPWFAGLSENAYTLVSRLRGKRWFQLLNRWLFFPGIFYPELPKPPFWLRFGLTLFTAVLVPVYWVSYGPANFLWLSDLALFLSVLVVWIPSPLLLSMLAVGVLPLEIVWNLDFFANLLFGWQATGLASYMFDASYPLPLRLLSLFHVALPPLWIVLLLRWGYDRRAWGLATAFHALVIMSSRAFTSPAANINWAFLPEQSGWGIPAVGWLAILLAAPPLLLFLPLHFLFRSLFHRAPFPYSSDQREKRALPFTSQPKASSHPAST